jgi:hypothetical protein
MLATTPDRCDDEVVSASQENPVRQLVAAFQAAAAVTAEWAERTGVVTAEAINKLSNDPAIRALLARWRAATIWDQRRCECRCADSHPNDVGVCDNRAVITRRLPRSPTGRVDVPLCAPCAVAQGVAELPS